jgi:redox-sensitive bicupin YhaK (pirin superfamily)
MSPPRYQEIHALDIPSAALADGAGTARVIAGELAGVRGPAATITPMVIADLSLNARRTAELSLPDGFTTMLVVQHGSVSLDGAQIARGVEIALFDRAGERITITANENARALLLSGRPIGEPVVGQGPFVMNTREEIRQAMVDYQTGRMGSLA